MEAEEHIPYRSARKVGKPMGAGAPHIPNKAERKLLTRMMQKSGQSEDEVRNSKSNRQKLAKASQSMSTPKHNRENVRLKRLRRDIMKYTGLPHYDTRINAIAKLYNSRGRWLRCSMSEAVEKILEPNFNKELP